MEKPRILNWQGMELTEYRDQFALVLQYSKRLNGHKLLSSNLEIFSSERFLIGLALDFLISDDSNSFTGYDQYVKFQEMGIPLDLKAALDCRDKIIYRLLFKLKIFQFTLDNQVIPKHSKSYPTLLSIRNGIRTYLETLPKSFESLEQVAKASNDFDDLKDEIELMIKRDGADLTKLYAFSRDINRKANLRTLINIWEETRLKKEAKTSLHNEQ